VKVHRTEVTKIVIGLAMLAMSGMYTLQYVLADETSSENASVSSTVDTTNCYVFDSDDVPQAFLSVLAPCPFIDYPVVQTRIGDDKVRLQGSVSVSEQLATPLQVISQLMTATANNDTERARLDKEERLHNRSWTRFVGRSKDMLQYATTYSRL
jgi:hypothetical protein